MGERKSFQKGRGKEKSGEEGLEGREKKGRGGGREGREEGFPLVMG